MVSCELNKTQIMKKETKDLLIENILFKIDELSKEENKFRKQVLGKEAKDLVKGLDQAINYNSCCVTQPNKEEKTLEKPSDNRYNFDIEEEQLCDGCGAVLKVIMDEDYCPSPDCFKHG